MNRSEIWRELDLGSLLQQPELIRKHQVTNSILDHERKWQQPSYNIIKDRYQSIPHYPKQFNQKTVDRLSDPIKGKFSRLVEKYDESNQMKSDYISNQTSKAGGVFLTGNDEDEESEYIPEASLKLGDHSKLSSFHKRLNEAKEFAIQSRHNQSKLHRNPNKESWKQKFEMNYKSGDLNNRNAMDTTRNTTSNRFKGTLKSKTRLEYKNPASEVRIKNIRSSGYGYKSSKPLKTRFRFVEAHKESEPMSNAQTHQEVSYQELMQDFDKTYHPLFKTRKPKLPTISSALAFGNKPLSKIRTRSANIKSFTNVKSKNNNSLDNNKSYSKNVSKSAPAASRRQNDIISLKPVPIKVTAKQRMPPQSIFQPVLSSPQKLSSSKADIPKEIALKSKSKLKVQERSTKQILEVLNDLKSSDTNVVSILGPDDAQLTTQLTKYAERIDTRFNNPKPDDEGFDLSNKKITSIGNLDFE